MRKINDAHLCAQDLIQSAFLIHIGSQNEFFTSGEQKALSAIRQELDRLNKRAVDIISKKPCPELIADKAMEDLEAILSKELDDALFDADLDAQGLMDGILKDFIKGSADDL